MKEKINHPSHYSPDTIEVIDAIEAWDLGFHLGNVVKYISRAGKKTKGHEEDCEKALWYLKRFVWLHFGRKNCGSKKNRKSGRRSLSTKRSARRYGKDGWSFSKSR